MIVNFPWTAYWRRYHARKPRGSKNGEADERVSDQPRQTPFKPRRSKNGTPEQRAAKRPSAEVVILKIGSVGTIRPNDKDPSSMQSIG
jgi:hypothetical protein